VTGVSQVPISENEGTSMTAGSFVTSGNYGSLNDSLPNATFATITGATNTTFVAACAGNISNTGYDNWAIDNNQNLANIRSGI
jgi:hypothetical protein